MYIVREIVQCKPGKVREMVNKFKGVSDIAENMGYKPFRFYTDVSGAEFWTLVAEAEVETIDDFFTMMDKVLSQDEARQTMSGYHELIQNGRREIYKGA